jgi:predicted PurR-regulated permease PerM
MKIDKDWIKKLIDAGFVLLWIFIILLSLTINYKPVGYLFFIAFVTTIIFLTIMVWIEKKANEELDDKND